VQLLCKNVVEKFLLVCQVKNNWHSKSTREKQFFPVIGKLFGKFFLYTVSQKMTLILTL